MGEVRIRIDDETLLKRLNLSARAHSRTLDEEIVHLLRSGLSAEGRQETAYEAAVRISAMTPEHVKQTSSLKLLREDRDR